MQIVNILGPKKKTCSAIPPFFFFFNSDLDQKLDLRGSNWSVCSLKVVDVIGE